MGLREEILAADDLVREPVEAWGRSFYLQTMSGELRERYEAGLFNERHEVDRGRLRARLIVFCAVDEAGARVFEDGDVEALAAKSGRELGRLAAVAQRLNGLLPGDREDAAKK